MFPEWSTECRGKEKGFGCEEKEKGNFGKPNKQAVQGKNSPTLK